MRVSQLRLPDPLEERDLGMEEYHTQMESGLSQLADGKSDCGLSDMDRMSLPSSTGLSQLSVVGDDYEDDGLSAAGDFSQGRLEMSVASTRPSLASSSCPPHGTLDTPNDTLSEVGGGYSIISHTDGCQSPSYSITGVRTPPPPPVRSSPLHETHAKLEETHASLPRNLKEYVDRLSVANERQIDDEEHQRNFEMWLKSVTPYSQRTCGSEGISSMSNLGSPLARQTSQPLQGRPGVQYHPKPSAQSLYERYARLRQSSTLPTHGRTAVNNHNRTSHGMSSMLTLHSSDVSVRVPAVTDSPGSVKSPMERPAKPSVQATALSNSYTAALETIELLCETADESDSIANDEPLSSSADQSFKTAFTSLDTVPSARLAISREYDAGDELASFGSSSGDSAWETEDSSGSEERSVTTTKTTRQYASKSRTHSKLCSLLGSLSRALTLSTPSRGPTSSSWSRLCLSALVVLCMSILTGKYYASAPTPSHSAKCAVDIHELKKQAPSASVFMQAVPSGATPFPSRVQPIITTPSTIPKMAGKSWGQDINSHESKSHQAKLSHERLHPLFSVKNDVLEYIFILAICLATAYFVKNGFVKLRLALKPRAIESSLRYVPGRKIVIRPSRKSIEAQEDHQVAQREKLGSKECPIMLEHESAGEDMASSGSSIVTVVPASEKVAQQAEIAICDIAPQAKQSRAASTPAKVSRKEVSTPREARAATLSPSGSDRVLRSHTKLRCTTAEPAASASSPTRSISRNPAPTSKEKLDKDIATTPIEGKPSKPAKSAVRARTVPAPARSAGDKENEILPRHYEKAASVPARNRKHESFHVCFIHGSSGVGKSSLLQRAKRGTFFDPEHPSYPGPESLEEFKNLRDVKHLHFEKRETLTTLVFGYGRMLENPDSPEAKAWKEMNKVYTLPNVEKSKFDKRGSNVHIFLYTVNDKSSQREAVKAAARTLVNEPDSQIAMVLAKCDLTRSERSLESTQTQVHIALQQAIGPAHSMERVTYYRTSAKTCRGVDDLFRDIARKLRKEASMTLEGNATLPMQLD